MNIKTLSVTLPEMNSEALFNTVATSLNDTLAKKQTVALDDALANRVIKVETIGAKVVQKETEALVDTIADRMALVKIETRNKVE